MAQQEQVVDVEALVVEFEQKLDRLKILYEQYFMGLEKREPLVPLKDVVRVMRLLDQQQIRNTGLRYRFRNLVQRFNSFKTYWSRTNRAIENGTYFRDVARMGRSLAKKGISVAVPVRGRARNAAEVERAVTDAVRERERHDTGETPVVAPPPEPGRPAPILFGGETDDEQPTNPNIRPAAEPPPRSLPAATRRDLPALPAPPRRPAPVAASAGISESELQSLYRRFVKAKQLCGEDVGGVRYEVLARSIAQQIPKIREQHGGREVEFQVVIRDGRAILRAKPRE